MNQNIFTMKPRISAATEARTAQRAVARCAAIARYEILDTPDEPAFDDVARLAATICETEFAAISFVTDDRQWFKARAGFSMTGTPISQSFCAHAIEQSDVFVVNDASRDPLFAENPIVTGPPFVRFYAGAPLRAADGTPIATLCIFDQEPRPAGIDPIERETLTVLAMQVQAQLELRRALIGRDAQAALQQDMATELAHVANHDPLTGLPNRLLFLARCAEALEHADQNSGSVAVLMIDVDHFKQINDSMGHDAGDALLRRFATRLRSAVRKSDTIARLGGDEFGAILRNTGSAEQLTTLLASLNTRLRKPFSYKGRSIECRASIGVACYPDHATTVEGLIKCSDLALGNAKTARDCSEVFVPEMADRFEVQVQMLALARQMIREDRIIPHYQPKVNLMTGEVLGFEALLRWQHSDGAVAMPAVLSAAFSNRELATAISTRMTEKVLSDIARWIKAGVAFGRVAINSCISDFMANDYAERLLESLAAHAVPTRAIEIEITEGVFLDRGSHHVARALWTLDARGVRIALDDFGTGYASLTHLKQFPVHVLKIDRSFVAGVGKNPDDTAIVRALIALGASLGLETVAEGIETVEQAASFRAYGCDIGQGYLFGAACAAADVPAAIVGHLHRAAA